MPFTAPVPGAGGALRIGQTLAALASLAVLLLAIGISALAWSMVERAEARVFEEAFAGRAEEAGRVAALLHGTQQAVLLGGLTIGLLLAVLVWVLAGSRDRAVRLAGRATAELRVSNAALGEEGVRLAGALAEQQQAEAGLRLLARLTASMSEAVIVADAHLRVVEFTGAAERIYGWSRAEVLGWNLLAGFGTIFPDEDGAEVGRKLAAREEVRAQVCVRRKGGAWLELDLVAVPLRDEGGTFSGWLSVARDVSELAAAHRQLRETEARAHRALTASRQVEWELDTRRGTPLAGPEWEAVTGRTFAEASDLAKWGALLHPEDRHRVEAELARCLAGLVPVFEADFRVTQPDQGWRSLRSVGRVDRVDAHGKADRITGMLTDVTHLRELQSRVAGAERLAATGTLARGMAHEINNPLASVVSNLHFALERLAELGVERAGEAGAGPWQGDISEALEEAAEGAQRIKGIVKDLRAFALGELPPGPAAAPLLHAAGDARRVAAQDLARCRTVAFALPPVACVALSHPDLVQLLAHLLINAGQATCERPNDVRLAAAALPPAQVELTVSDTGQGMSEDEKSRAFEPFFTTRKFGKGRGLGLSVCRGIVQAVGGEISISSEQGAGTVVKVVLPAAAEIDHLEARREGRRPGAAG